MPSEPYGECPGLHPGGPDPVRGRGSDLLFLASRMVLWNHYRDQFEKRVPATDSVPAGGPGLVRAVAGAASSSWQDSKPADDAATESRGTTGRVAARAKTNGRTSRAGTDAGGTAGDRGQRRTHLLWRFGRDDQGRGG